MVSKQLVAAAALLVLLVASEQAAAWWLFNDAAADQQAAGRRAIATFDMDNVRGTFKFAQKSPSEPTSVDYELSGLQGNNKLYHVHVKPLPIAAGQRQLDGSLCSEAAVGGHLNPHNVKEKLPSQSAPLDKYELGDMSGKHGPLKQAPGAAPDTYKGSYTDDKLSLFGEHSPIGRSIVIHKNDGKRWVCASIVELK